jgi:Mrp family chromosome partitioning ATPase
VASARETVIMERLKRPAQRPDLRVADPDYDNSLPEVDFVARNLVESRAIEYVRTRVAEVAPEVLERSKLVTSERQDEIANAYRMLRTQVLQRMGLKHWQTLAIVSPAAGEGKTLTAINLALSIASTRSHTALLVDLDWREPSVHRYFDFAPEVDIHAHLRGECALADVLVNPGIPRFCFAPCGEAVPGASELLGSLGPFVSELSGRYSNRIVLFDLPPLLATDDALSFLPHVDAALLVVEEGRTSRDDVRRSIEMIGEERLLGTVINRSARTLPRYGA